MLQTQINYWSYLETVRHDVETEKEATRSNKAKEAELNRHQVVVEIETERHNRAMEDYNFQSLAETIRSNKERERLTAQEIQNNFILGQESNRIATYNAQTNRKAVEYNYSIGLKNVRVAEKNAETNRLNAYTQQQSVANQNWYNRQQAQSNRISAKAAQVNAEASYMNALTRQKEQAAEQAYKEGSLNVSRYTAEQNASLGWQNLTIAQHEQERKNKQLALDSNVFEWKKYTDSHQINVNYINAAANILRTITSPLGQTHRLKAAIPTIDTF